MQRNIVFFENILYQVVCVAYAVLMARIGYKLQIGVCRVCS